MEEERAYNEMSYHHPPAAAAVSVNATGVGVQVGVGPAGPGPGGPVVVPSANAPILHRTRYDTDN